MTAGRVLPAMSQRIARPLELAETLLAPLDALRRSWLRALGPLCRPLMAESELRVAVGLFFSVAVALALTLLAPLWLLAVSPLLLGVPHLLADVRYLVVRPGLHRRLSYAVLVGVPLVCAGLGAGMAAGLCAIAATIALAPGARWRKLAALPLLAAVALWGFADHYQRAELLLAHAHNFIGVLLLFLWRPPRRAVVLLPLLLFLLVSVALTTGALSAADAGLRSCPEELDLDLHLAALTPSLPPQWGTRVVLLFAFAQAVHYSAWLRLIPEQDRDRKTPRTFAASLRALRRELGAPVLYAVVLLGLGLGVWGVHDLGAARVGYFRLAQFHGYLELSALALIFVAWQPLRPARPRPGG